MTTVVIRRMVYFVAGSVANTIAATKKLLAADGWQPYVAPLDEHDDLAVVQKGTRRGCRCSLRCRRADRSKHRASTTRRRRLLALAVSRRRNRDRVRREPAVPELHHGRHGRRQRSSSSARSSPLRAGRRYRQRTPRRNGRMRNWMRRRNGASPITSAKINDRSCCRFSAAMTARRMSKSRSRRLRCRKRSRPARTSSACHGRS